MAATMNTGEERHRWPHLASHIDDEAIMIAEYIGDNG